MANPSNEKTNVNLMIQSTLVRSISLSNTYETSKIAVLIGMMWNRICDSAIKEWKVIKKKQKKKQKTKNKKIEGNA